MSGLPPTLNAETGTPAHEWAQSTTTAAFEREDAAPASGAIPAFPRESAAPASGATPAFARGNAVLAPTCGASYLPPGVLQTRTISSASTPGIPGAYPREDAGPTNTEAVTQAAKDAMNTVTTTAQQYYPIVQDTATQAAQRAAEVASQASQAVQNYMSGSTAVDNSSTVRASLADTPHQASLPSTETSGALPKENIGGAGALPGHVSEEAVTKLPDERSAKRVPAIYPDSRGYPSTAPPDVLAPASQQASAVYPIAVAAVPGTAAFTPLAPSGQHPSHAQYSAVTLRESLPSQESSGQMPYTHQDGVGALPGTKHEAGVAVLPDESRGLLGSKAATSSAVGTHPRDFNTNPAIARPREEVRNKSLDAGERKAGRDVSGGVGSPVGSKSEEGVAVLPDKREKTTGGLPTVAEGGKGDKINEMDQAEREECHRVAGTQKKAPSKHGEGEGKEETQMSPPEINLQPRTHALGTPGATWRGVGVGTASGYTHGEGVDIGRRGGDETPEEGTETQDTGYHPAELHPLPADMSSAQIQSHGDTKEPGADAKGDAVKEGSAEGGAGAGGHAEGGDRAHKASFMEKMKGEAKVMIGKLEGKKGAEKVQEGKRLKAGEA